MIGSFEQGAIEWDDAVIWLYYRGDNFSLDDEDMFELKNIFPDAKTEIAIDNSTKNGALVLYNVEGIFFHLDDIKKALYIE